MRVAVVQRTATMDVRANRSAIAEQVRADVAAGSADLVVLPEASQRDFGPTGASLTDAGESLEGPFVGMLQELATEIRTTIIAGMFESSGEDRPFNTLVVVDAGGLREVYRKTHLYDAFGYRESDRLLPGPLEVVTVPIAGMTVGLMTCYDLRFPELGRALVDQGADVLVVSAAWLAGASKTEHWNTLLRARAIENTVWTIGAAQGLPRYCGHSAVIDPMGHPVATLGETDGTIRAELSSARIDEVRSTNPSLVNRRWRVVPIEST